ncbi:MAG TPA: carboxypeptidase regulatory-like domain-containing protein, partial [Polyangiaceae bacterium]|nr:carboxypeptidase regulatory-like domain-containing protein [Polyangiaceae bacterium]
LDLAVGSSRGAVGSGSVEARLGGETVGIAKVQGGTARVVARFARKPSKLVELTLHYLPSEPWWTASAPLPIEVTLAAPSYWGSLAWLLGFVAIAVWLLKSWQRPARTLRTTSAGAPKARAAAVVVVEADDAAAGWRGIVRDAHDDTPVPDAQVSIVAEDTEGARAVARATTAADGRFELPAVTASSETRFVVTARWHATLKVALPPHGRLEIDLVTRRRQLVARFVAWAAREGHGIKGRSEPTPGDVRLAAQRVRRPDIAAWADAVEGAAYGPDPVDEPVERGVLDREPPERGRPPNE